MRHLHVQEIKTSYSYSYHSYLVLHLVVLLRLVEATSAKQESRAIAEDRAMLL